MRSGQGETNYGSHVTMLKKPMDTGSEFFCGQGETNYKSHVTCLLAPKAKRLVCLYQLDDHLWPAYLRVLS